MERLLCGSKDSQIYEWLTDKDMRLQMEKVYMVYRMQ